MILRALYDLAQQEGLAEDLDYEQREVRFALHIHAGGGAGVLVDMVQYSTSTSRGKPSLQKPIKKIPRQFKRPGTKPPAFFIVDNPTFVLGWAPPGSSPREFAKANDRHERYVEKLTKAQNELPVESAGAKALKAFIRFLSTPDRTRPLDECYMAMTSERDRIDLASNLLIFVEPHGTTPLHLMPEIEAYWRSIRSAESSTGDSNGFRCLVTGVECSPVDKHPPIRGVPGANPAGTALISFNEKVFESYGLLRNDNGPISQPASEAIGNALNRLLNRNPTKPDGTPLARRHVRLSYDTVALFWTEKDAEVDWFEQLTEDPDAVEATLLEPLTGRKSVLEDPASFHTLILSGAQGRSVVRAYGCRTTAAVAQEVQRYLGQVRIQRPFNKGEGAYPLRTYLRSLATFGDEKNLPPQLAGVLYMAVLEGTPFPRMVLDAALRRTRLEAPRMSDNDPRKKAEAIEAFAARCGLIRAYFHRQSLDPKEIPVSLDRNCREIGYMLGRLFAVLDKAQGLAIPGANATIVDRFYGAASTAPATVFPTLIQKGEQHMGKLRGDKEKPWAYTLVDKAKSEVMELMEAKPFPKTLDLTSQGLFALGFHHQRQDFFAKKETPTTL